MFQELFVIITMMYAYNFQGFYIMEWLYIKRHFSYRSSLSVVRSIRKLSELRQVRPVIPLAEQKA